MGLCMRSKMRSDVCLDLRLGMCLDLRLGMCLDMRLGMCLDLRLDIHLGVCLDRRLDVYFAKCRVQPRDLKHVRHMVTEHRSSKKKIELSWRGPNAAAIWYWATSRKKKGLKLLGRYENARRSDC